MSRVEPQLTQNRAHADIVPLPLLETPLFREQEMRREIAAEYLSCWRGESNAEPSLTDAR